MKEIKTYLIVLLLLTVNLLDAQLLVSPNNNAATLVNQIVGNNVTITNAVINCGSGGSGIFLSNNSNIGLNNGILLTTGKATNAMGTNNDADKGECFNTNLSISDPQLIAIEPKATYDGCILEFDIKPSCNTLQIKYVFGSEEYPEFVGSQFNDAFGFFIWGPNPAGGAYSGNNIARLPNSTQVTINNINNGSGRYTQHPSYTDIKSGDEHMAALVTKLRASPQWKDMLIVLTYDENGGYWDHVPPTTAVPPTRDAPKG